MKYALFFVSLILSSSHVVGCSGNLLARYSTQKSLQEQAEYDMQKGDYVAAQTKLLSLIEGDSTNYKAVSLLAACYAAIGGVKLLDILINAAVKSSANGSGNDGAVKLAEAILPKPTSAMFMQMELANQTMASIPQASLTSEMLFQQHMFLDLYFLLQIINLLTTLRAGEVLTNAQVTLLFDTMADINALSGSNDNKVTETVTTISNGINDSAGANQNEQITNFLTPFI